MATEYGSYLDVDSLLEHVKPRTSVPDEYLFIVTHQALELWFAEALHEIDQITGHLAEDRVTAARNGLLRLHRIVALWMAHMDVLDTMPSTEFAAFRGDLGGASGMQSGQFRELELASGATTDGVMRIAHAVGSADARITERTTRVSLREAFLELVERAGQTVRGLYEAGGPPTELRALADDLVEYDLLFSQWRYRHCLMVMRAIGFSPGTGGSSGFTYLKKTLENWFFPELWSARRMSDNTQDGSPLVVMLDGSVAADRGLLGGKGWGLQQMGELGIPVPPAFTLTTAACHQFYASGNQVSDALWAEVLEHLEALERRTGARFGATPPLLVSVRSGAPVSMPGMMDTLLNVGLTPAAVDWLRTSGAEESLLTELVDSQEELPADREEALAQLKVAVSRVFESWHSDRAQVYREANGIPDGLGTGVTVQAMVFGNRDARSGTGVYMTRNPITGEPVPFGEWLARAQGEELVSGKRTPEPLTALNDQQPEVYRQLVTIGKRLERSRRSVLEIEFTVESGVLYLLQVRDSSASGLAAAHWAVDLVHEGLIDIQEALSRVPADWEPAVSGGSGLGGEVARGLGVSQGIATGYVVDSADEAADLAEAGKPVVLARPTTSPHDIHGFLVAAAVITERGGSTSHAAVVGRQIGLPCVVGCGDGVIENLVGKLVTVDGTRGTVHEGEAAVAGESRHSTQIECLLRWRSEAVAAS
ncbi:Tryptophan 2,3-dioxygenase [Amycolatopsis xylanica]|uniref:Tryptophan 2,3-dioxygenase n=1 Tax=Amycolatopsis xylanica TaxID=589385 RepID=A0A1H3PFV7_9PSEU|nr:pyruvate, phosphate dikinase [Amycolatopsis xylanica]SDY99928.1 Tryptophan 2,3-dioxygenase [Amycolatopsis xylanica]